MAVVRLVELDRTATGVDVAVTPGLSEATGTTTPVYAATIPLTGPVPVDRPMTRASRQGSVAGHAVRPVAQAWPAATTPVTISSHSATGVRPVSPTVAELMTEASVADEGCH